MTTSIDLKSKTALITGGATGIGLALAQRFMAAGSRVIICGRREAALREAAAANPGLITRTADLARQVDRIALVEWVLAQYPTLDILINNAGIQRRVRLAEPEPWHETRLELAINVDAPIHLALAFLPHLRTRKGMIVNVTSGLSFAPYVPAPIYSATKAALHSFTLSLRHQIVATGVRVVEIIPPAVNTDLGGAGLHTMGAPLEPFADEVMSRFVAGEEEIAYGMAAPRAAAAHAAFDEAFKRTERLNSDSRLTKCRSACSGSWTGVSDGTHPWRAGYVSSVYFTPATLSALLNRAFWSSSNPLSSIAPAM
jgi:uncharacterized oxidoreductase